MKLSRYLIQKFSHNGDENILRIFNQLVNPAINIRMTTCHLLSLVLVFVD